MSRSIQPGDFVRVTHPSGESGDYVIKDIVKNNIQVYPFDDPESISIIIMTSRGLEVSGDEQVKYSFEFFYNNPPKSIQQLFTPVIDDASWYQPLVPLARFDFRSVKDWINSSTVRINLFQAVRLGVSLFPFSSTYSQQIWIDFNSPLRQQYQNYILSTVLPRYTSTEPKAMINGEIEADLTEQLIRAAFGALEISYDDVYLVFELIFPLLTIRRVPDDGDCYYSAIGLHNNIESAVVRADLSIAFRILSDEAKNSLVSTALSACPENEGFGLQYAQNPGEILERFDDILMTPCGKGRRDCVGCLWGGNFLDELVNSFYTIPVVSVGLVIEEPVEYKPSLGTFLRSARLQLELILAQLRPNFWNPLTQTLSFMVNQPTITISTLPIITGPGEDKMMNSTQFIGYIAISGKHVDGILPRLE